jgi:thiol-disulfide isomerase/thioredoxin
VTSDVIHAPELAGAVEWLNVPHPLTLKKDLRGKIVLLDFWTYGCINCMHVLPDLKRLEHKYREELVVVGIHSAKFTNERAALDGLLYIADTYNHKIKVLDPRTRKVTTVAGSGAMGSADGPLKSATFHEPGGIAAAAGKLYVADTNNHAIRRIDLDVGEVGTVVL